MPRYGQDNSNERVASLLKKNVEKNRSSPNIQQFISPLTDT